VIVRITTYRKERRYETGKAYWHDVHHATISVAVMDSSGKLIMECILETKAATILEFLEGLRGSLSMTFEEGASAAWLHNLLKPHVSISWSVIHDETLC
jgi:hypothetical protein